MRGAGIRWYGTWSILGTLLSGSWCATRAQEAPPTDPPPADSPTSSPTATAEPEAGPPHYFTLDRLDAYLELEGDYNHTRVQSNYRQRYGTFKRTQTNRDYTFEERLGLGLTGTVVDPSCIAFDGEVSFALTQSRYEERGWLADENDTDPGHLLQYDMRVNFFTGKKLSGSAYALRGDDRISRRFQPTLDETRNGFGSSWDFADEKFPMTLSYDYLETDRTGNWDKRDDEHYTESNLHYGATWNVSDYHRFKLAYEHADTKQEYQGLRDAFDTTRDLFTLEHEIEFGRQHQHSFRTLAHWQEESGDFARDYFEIGPQLTLHHSDTFETMYKYQFNRERYEGLDIETQRFDLQAVHQLYTNLTTTVDLFGLHENVENDVTTTQYGASVDWQYNRKNAYGRLYADLGIAYDTEESQGSNRVRVVLNESATFRDPLNITLRNRDVLRQTIVVTDPTNRRFFVAGRDYGIVRLGDVTQLVRFKTGLIADGDTVLIDYQYRTPINGQIDTIRVDGGIEQRFDNGLTPYYRFAFRNEEMPHHSTGFSYLDFPGEASTGFARAADRTDHHRLGLKYEQKRYTVGTEFEIFDDTVEPYYAFHGDGLVHILQRAEHTIDASARFSRFFFEGGYDRRDVTILDVDLDHRWQLRENLSTFERMAYRWEDDSVDGTTHAWDVGVGVDYVMGDLTAEVSFEYDRLDLPQSVEDDFGLYFRIRRDFPNVFGKR